jgi:hypothetical protein
MDAIITDRPEFLIPIVAFKTPPQSPSAGRSSPVSEPVTDFEDEDPSSICCRACDEPITAPSYQITVRGAHLHTFANPLGIVFEVGCFSRVRAVSYVGPETDEFTWFKGFRWRIALCGRCQVHLGWRFASGPEEGFHALIVDRLRYPAL